MKMAILGGGSWGTALAVLWSRNGHQVDLWVRDKALAQQFQAEGRNTKYLSDIPFPAGLTVTTDLAATMARNKVLVLAVPLQAYREFLAAMATHLQDHCLILVSKGIELGTLLLPSQIVTDVLGESFIDRTFALSGPSFAREVAEDKPTTVVLAGREGPLLMKFQNAFNCPRFRMYRNADIIGVELCGALKNVIAIAAGMVTGMGWGDNTLAGLITRGLSEISRLGVALGARPETFAGLAGMGDLILTCNGKQSRNLQVGMALARGLSLEQALSNLGMVAEGVHTTKSAFQLSQSLGVELPITTMVYRILYEGLTPRLALEKLMARSLKAEGAC